MVVLGIKIRPLLSVVLAVWVVVEPAIDLAMEFLVCNVCIYEVLFSAVFILTVIFLPIGTANTGGGGGGAGLPLNYPNNLLFLPPAIY